MTPLHVASLKGHQRLVQLFLDRGANPQARVREQWTPLYLALISKNEKVSRTISYYVSDIRNHLTYASKCLTPLHLASYLGLAKSLHFFLSKGANIDALDYQGNTPLHHALASEAWQLGYNPAGGVRSQMFKMASCEQVLETVAALIRAGADIDRRGYESRTPKQLAFNYEDERVRNLFGFVPKNIKSTRSTAGQMHIGRSWMQSDQVSKEQMSDFYDSFRHGYQLSLSNLPGLAEREEAIRSCIPEGDDAGDQNNSDFIATGLDGFPLLSQNSNLTSLTGLNSLGVTTWSRLTTNLVIANLVKTEYENPASVHPAQHHQQVESFPRLAHNGGENPLKLSAKNMWREFEMLTDQGPPW